MDQKDEEHDADRQEWERKVLIPTDTLAVNHLDALHFQVQILKSEHAATQQRWSEARVQSVDHLELRHRRKRLVLSFQEWCVHLSTSKQHRQRIAVLSRRRDAREVATLFVSWRVVTRVRTRKSRHHTNVLLRVISRMHNEALSRAFTQWHELLIALRRRQHCISTVARRWQNKSVYAAIETWLDAVRASRHHRHVLQKAVRRMTNRCGVAVSVHERPGPNNHKSVYILMRFGVESVDRHRFAGSYPGRSCHGSIAGGKPSKTSS
jgi:hypothetical protein